ncbi:putative next to BRCA1 1 protein [Scophthalmus maximus]|uniref:Putative next to BRCA1 1 protein n=1 Tax=Scophthalmus maximus TaxID=52904 RepID=A0A2U9CNP6_SCOMX|nr:next to BRCA1 gene 1 protein isoform X2 [Scophthalmus maximus]AWP18254.1 putative next to BRCA1 1 protein [Scophthalmus maximus]
MDFYINLKVNFRGNSKNFLLSGSETKSWESMEAMVKRSFGLCSLQLTYFDEENEEVSINSQVEYEEALKTAARQGNRLHMNVYETRGLPARVPTTKASGAEPKRGFRPPQHCPALAQVVSRKVQAAVPEQGMVILKEVKGTKEEDKTPPAWFTSYMEKFKDQVVREAVEKICREFSGQCCIHKPLGGGGTAGGAGGGRGEAVGGAEAQQIPEVSSTLPGAPSSSTPPCSSCRGQTTGGGYQCSVCTSCTLCEPCSFSHDPSHNLVRARTPLSIPEHGSPAPDHSKFYRRGDRSFRKAEKQRLKAEKRLLKAEVKEIRKQLRMERRGIQWSSSQRDGSSSPVLLQPRATQHNSPERPKRPCPLVVPTMTAAFLDENLPDGTRLRPGTKFIKYWKMRNTGTISWSADTKLKFMWGNLAVGSGDRWREVSVPFLQPGQVGIVSVALCAPTVDGSYTSHWRLAHTGEQFGPRVWCSIVVDPLAPAPMMADGILVSPCVTPQGKNPVVKDGKACIASREQPLMSVDQEEYYIPSVDLLTAQDLLSFELLDINIVQELESVPNNTPSDMTPCISPLPQDGHLQDKSSPSLGLIQEETDVINSIMDVPHGAGSGAEGGGVPAQEEGEDDISGSQFVCETVIRSMTLEEAPDHAPLRGSRPGTVARPAAQSSSSSSSFSSVKSKTLKTEETPEGNPGSSTPHTLKPPATLKASLPSTLKASLPAPMSVAPGPSSAPTLHHTSARASTAADDVDEFHMESICVESSGKEREKEPEEVKEKEGGEKKTRSRSSSTSSEDYIIILPDCFDTSRPLGESMYSSALSQPGDIPAKSPTDPDTPSSDLSDHPGSAAAAGELAEANEDAAAPGTELSGTSSANDMLCTSQTLDDEPLTPEVVAPPKAIVTPSPESSGEIDIDAAAAASAGEGAESSELYQTEDASGPEQTQTDTGDTEDTEDNPEDPRHPGITSGLVKGALSVAASAYKALFTGQGPTQPPVDASTQDTMMAVLVEMGFGDRLLNQRLLKKHNYNLLDVVNELVQMTDNDWYSTRY